MPPKFEITLTLYLLTWELAFSLMSRHDQRARAEPISHGKSRVRILPACSSKMLCSSIPSNSEDSRKKTQATETYGLITAY